MQKLYQQMDEELKLMVRFCSEGGRIMGPYLREMDEVIHSEYDIIGSRAKDSFEALKISGHSPCIIGSPVKKACALIHQYESESRRYYGGGVGIYRHNPRGTADGDLDVSVIIRMAEISQSGRLDYRVGTNIMVHSNPETEMRSTIRKTEGFLKILKGQSDTKKEWLTPERRKIIEPLLQNCNDRMSPFWRTPQNSWFRGERFDHLTIQIIDGGNDFSWMLLHMLNHMGAKAEIIELDHFTPPQIAPDLVILGSGPGFIKSDTLQDKYKPVLNYLMHHEIPVLGIGLGHQLLCDYYGFDIAHTNDNTNHLSSQGTQRQIMIFDRPHYAGFYNSFAMIYDHKTAEKQGIYCETDEFNHIMTLRSHHHIGFQFHPESVMSETGYGLLNQAISLLTTKWL
jgi:phenazine biosynthesis protein phzE